MEITIKATPKEIAALVVALQERQDPYDLADKVAEKMKEISNKRDEAWKVPTKS